MESVEKFPHEFHLRIDLRISVPFLVQRPGQGRSGRRFKGRPSENRPGSGGLQPGLHRGLRFGRAVIRE